MSKKTIKTERTKPEQQVQKIGGAVLNGLPEAKSIQCKVSISIAHLNSNWAVPFKVPVRHGAQFINEMSDELVKANFPDMQVYIQQRVSKGGLDQSETWGAVIDIDFKIADIDAFIKGAGIPKPTIIWETVHGYKLVYFFKTKVEHQLFYAFTRWIVVATAADPNSTIDTQAQHLPHCIKTLADDEQQIVHFKAVQLTDVPLDLSKFTGIHEIPQRMAALFGGSRKQLNFDEREALVMFLHSIGMQVPATQGSTQSKYCPGDTHNSPKACKVTRRENKEIFVYCFSCGRCWHEVELYNTYVHKNKYFSDAPNPVELPFTWATKGLVECVLKNAGWEERTISLSVDVWKSVLAHSELKCLKERFLSIEQGCTDENSQVGVVLPNQMDIVKVYEQRLKPWKQIAPRRILFEISGQVLGYLDAQGRFITINTGAETIGSKKQSTKPLWRSGAGYCYVTKQKEKTIKAKKATITALTISAIPGHDASFEAHYAAALNGDSGPLLALGFPIGTIHQFPVCFVDSGFGFDVARNSIVYTQAKRIRKKDPNFDLMNFFKKLHDNGRLNFASWNDTKRFVMLMAAALVRTVVPGQQGVYWIVGPSGIGKLFIDSLLSAVYRQFSVDESPAVFTLSLGSETETQRSFFSGRNACYLRVTEAGKGRNKKNILIEMSGRSRVILRGMQKDPVEIDNSFIYIADAAEGIADGREVSRRTVTINLANFTTSKIKNQVIELFELHAHDIIGSLQDMIEEKGADWFRTRDDNHERPFIQHALAELLEVELDEVESADMSPFFDMLQEYVDEVSETSLVVETMKKNKTRKVAEVLKKVPSFRYTHLKELMSTDRVVESMPRITEPRGYKELLKQYSTSKSVIAALRTELSGEFAYADVGKTLNYFPVTIGDTSYAFRFFNKDRDFIFIEEAKLCKIMEWEPHSPNVTTDNIETASDNVLHLTPKQEEVHNEKEKIDNMPEEEIDW